MSELRSSNIPVMPHCNGQMAIFTGRRGTYKTLPKLPLNGWEIVGSSGHKKVSTRGKPSLERPGRPRGERIVRQALVDPTVTRPTIRADVGVAIVPQTISRHLAKANLKSKRPFPALPLTPKHRQLRLQWCQARSMWNVTDWQKVVFSDESRFVLGTDDNRVGLWRCPGRDRRFYGSILQQLIELPRLAEVRRNGSSNDMSSALHRWRACSRPSCAVVAAPHPEQPLENDGRYGLRFFVPREAECCCLGSSRGYVRSFGDGHCRLRLTGPPPFHLRRRLKR
ncbi:HTH_Tnp_Tc3_2 domain-containing protein [Trichonephila clavipes]|nr:HTH_Tnp_Tc3_2 domain-containing protein [Trichonephila clavipes]